eukprot:GFUD01009744.1.p1 GENE.GFUD01009744.1~~GFUD01009744.1.p1  ORF type:complete len:127 (+),score=56.74 GFUD01009744.1:99-479(+)
MAATKTSTRRWDRIGIVQCGLETVCRMRTSFILLVVLLAVAPFTSGLKQKYEDSDMDGINDAVDDDDDNDGIPDDEDNDDDGDGILDEDEDQDGDGLTNAEDEDDDGDGLDDDEDTDDDGDGKEDL